MIWTGFETVLSPQFIFRHWMKPISMTWLLILSADIIQKLPPYPALESQDVQIGKIYITICKIHFTWSRDPDGWTRWIPLSWKPRKTDENEPHRTRIRSSSLCDCIRKKCGECRQRTTPGLPRKQKTDTWGHSPDSHPPCESWLRGICHPGCPGWRGYWCCTLIAGAVHRET